MHGFLLLLERTRIRVLQRHPPRTSLGPPLFVTLLLEDLRYVSLCACQI